MEEPKKVLYGALTVYRERGAFLRRLEQINKSKAAYDEAFKVAPNDLRLLIGRSRVCADAVVPEQAIGDARLALKVEPSNMEARHMNARALFTMTEFERATVTNARGLRHRKQPPYFKEGFDQGIATIEDCIGKHAGHVIEDLAPMIKEMETFNERDEYEPKKNVHKCRIPHEEVNLKITPLQKRKIDTLSRVLAMKYLGPMAYDKFFLKELVNDPKLYSANKMGSEILHDHVVRALEILCERQEMLRTQCPYFSKKYAERSESKRLSKYKQQLLENDRRSNFTTAKRMIERIEQLMRDYKIQEMVAAAERMQTFLDKKTPHSFPDKQMFIDRLYRAVGEGYLNQHRITYRLSPDSTRYRIAFLMGISQGRLKSYDSVIAQYPQKFVDQKPVLERFLADLDLCENSYMRCWLMYEIATILNGQKNYTLAKFYAKRCQRQAQSISSSAWWLNACFALMSGDMQQGNTNEIRVIVEEALQWCRNINNSEELQAFLVTCHELASELIATDETKAVKHRENQILKVMDESTRVETEVLFKRMALIPPGRRFVVFPSKKPMPSETFERRRRRQRGLTVVPGPEKTLPPLPKSNVPGLQLFDNV